MKGNEKKALACIYYHDDPDGHVSEKIIRDMINQHYNGMDRNPFRDHYDTVHVISRPSLYTDEFTDLQESATKFFDNIILFFVDLSFTTKTLPKLEAAINCPGVRQLVWIDHHDSSEMLVKSFNLDKYKNLNDISTVIYSKDACGAALSAYYASMVRYAGMRNEFIDYRGKNIIDDLEVEIDDKEQKIIINPGYLPNLPVSFNPHIFTFVSDKFLYHLDAYDRHTNNDPDANAFMFGFKVAEAEDAIEDYYNFEYCNSSDIAMSLPSDIDESDSAYYRKSYMEGIKDNNNLADTIINDGNVAYSYQMYEYEFWLKKAKIFDFFGFKIYVKNAMGNSLNFCGRLDWDAPDTPDMALIGYYDMALDKYSYSIYDTVKHSVAVNKIAESFGGGGHPGAAGFSTDLNLLPLFNQDPYDTDNFNNRFEEVIYESHREIYNYLLSVRPYKKISETSSTFSGTQGDNGVIEFDEVEEDDDIDYYDFKSITDPGKAIEHQRNCLSGKDFDDWIYMFNEYRMSDDEFAEWRNDKAKEDYYESLSSYGKEE